MKRRLTVDPARISKGCRELNPQFFAKPQQVFVNKVERAVGGKKRGQMNKTEAEFARVLQARQDHGDIVSFDYEGLTLRWPDGMRYTPDFVVVKRLTHPIESGEECPHVQLAMVEVKGAFGWQKDIVKFRAARANWPLFEFQFWQKLDGQWQQTR